MLQVVIVPIVKNEGDKERILEACRALHSTLQGADIRSKLDERLDRSPGFKFNDYEMRVGLPASVSFWVPSLSTLPCARCTCNSGPWMCPDGPRGHA